MSVPLIVLTNGRRDCLYRTITSAREQLTGVGSITIVNDSPNLDYHMWLDSEFIGGSFDCSVAHRSGPRGYWQAMQTVWDMARHQMSYFDTDAVFFLEDDFIFNEPVHLDPMLRVLNANPHLTQMALLRQSWFTNEQVAGGLIPALERCGHVFTACMSGNYSWIEHRSCFTGNPSLIPRRTFNHDWPDGAWSESRFGRLLFTDPAARGAYWGKRSDRPRVEHIGYERVGADY